MATFQSVLKEVKSGITETTPENVHKQLAGANGELPFTLIDCREKEEFATGHIPGAKHIPRGFLELRIEDAVPDRDAPIVVYCQGGTRSALAVESLARMGYSNVESMDGGFGKWKELDFPWDMPRVLTPKQLERYSRHTMIPEVGEEGQLKLLDARVLLLGAGGLGSPAALYLAAAGVGTMGIVDNDVVDESNLQRQIIHTTQSVNTPKVDSAAKTIGNLNPEAFVQAVRKYQPQVVGMSAFLATTMPAIGKTITALEWAGLRDQVKVLIGGAAVTPRYANSIGADGYAVDATRAVEQAKAAIGIG